MQLTSCYSSPCHPQFQFATFLHSPHISPALSTPNFRRKRDSPSPTPWTHPAISNGLKIHFLLTSSESTLAKVHQNTRLYLPLESTPTQKPGEGLRYKTANPDAVPLISTHSSQHFNRRSLPGRDSQLSTVSCRLPASPHATFPSRSQRRTS